MKLVVRKKVIVSDSDSICRVEIDETGAGRIVFRGRDIHLYGFTDVELLQQVIKKALVEVGYGGKGSDS